MRPRPERVEEALARLRRGVDPQVAADFAGVSLKRLRAWAQEAGVPCSKATGRAIDDHALRRAFEGDLPLSDLAPIFGLSPSGISRRALAAGAKPRHRIFAPEERERAVAAYVEGKTTRAAANLVGANGSTVLKWVRAAGHEVRPFGACQLEDHPWRQAQRAAYAEWCAKAKAAGFDKPEEAVRGLVLHGATRSAAAKQIGVSLATAGNWAKGLPAAPRANRADSAKRDKVRGLVSQGATRRAAAEAVGVCVATAQRWTKGLPHVEYRRRVPEPCRGPRDSAKYEELRRLVEQGLTRAAAAEVVGVTTATALRWAKDLPHVSGRRRRGPQDRERKPCTRRPRPPRKPKLVWKRSVPAPKSHADARDLLLELVAGGMTAQAAARRLNIPLSTAHKWAVGVRRSATAVQHDRALQLLEAGATYAQASASTGIPISTLRRYAREHGVASRKVAVEHGKAERAIALYLEGASTREAGAAVGHSFAWVQKVLREHGIQARPRVPVYSAGFKRDALEQLRAALERGETAQSVATRLGIRMGLLSSWARKAGCNPGHKSAPLIKHEKAIAEAYADGTPIKEIRARYGCSESHVTNVAHRYGLPIRNPFKRRELTNDERAESVRMFEAGHKVREIASTLHCKQETIRAALQDAGVVLRKGPRVSQEVVERCVELYEAGKSIRAITSAVKIDRKVVTRALEERGVEIRPRSESVWMARRGGTVPAHDAPRC